MKIQELEKLLQDFKKNLVFNKDLKNESWFNIGGKAKVFFRAENLNDVALVSQNKNTTFEFSIDKKMLEAICKEYIIHLKGKEKIDA